MGFPNVTNCTLKILGMHTFICLDTNFTLFLNKARIVVDSMESLSLYKQVIVVLTVVHRGFEGYGPYVLLLTSHKVSVL